MPSYSDIYAITNKQSRETVDRFLEYFLPQRTEAADEYEYPQYSGAPEIIYKEAGQVLDRCINNTKIDYRLYWRSCSNVKSEHAMVFFLSDGYVIFGLSTDDAYPKYATELLKR